MDGLDFMFEFGFEEEEQEEEEEELRQSLLCESIYLLQFISLRPSEN
jgi:hypothetical protein